MLRTARLVALTAACLVTGTLWGATSSAPSVTSGSGSWGTGAVTASAGELVVDGRPYFFTGFNVYNANSHGECGPALDDGGLEATLQKWGPGVRGMRAWFFQSMATTNGARDWSTFDRTLNAARDHGVKVVVTLGNQWADCDLQGFKTAAWYRSGYREPAAEGSASYREWIAEAATRYREHPAILAWQLLNEPEIRESETSACSADAADVLREWAADASSVVKAADPNHLVSIGTIGSGQCGAQEGDYAALHALNTIDLCELHDYNTTSPLPGDEWNGVSRRIEQCRSLGKPVLVGEMGVKPGDVGGTLLNRAEFVHSKLYAQRRAGIAGMLAWAWTGGESTTGDYDIGPGDPLIDVLRVPDGFAYQERLTKDVGMPRMDGYFRTASISDDGRFVSIVSHVDPRTREAAADRHAWLLDRATGGWEQVSKEPGAEEATVSADGRWVLYKTSAGDQEGDTDSQPDLYIYDALTGSRSLASGPGDGGEPFFPSISRDGRHVSFDENQPVLMDRDIDRDGLFEGDADTSHLRLHGLLDISAEGVSSGSVMSPSGRFVVFITLNAEVAGVELPSNSFADRMFGDGWEHDIPQVMLLDRDASGDGVFDEAGDFEMSLLSRTGSPATFASLPTDVSDSGVVAMWTGAPELGAPAPSTTDTVDPVTRANYASVIRLADGTWVTLDTDDESGAFGARLDDLGRTAAFATRRPLTPGDDAASVDAHVLDLSTGVVRRIAWVGAHPAGPGVAGGVGISGDGRTVTYGHHAGPDHSVVSGGDLYLQDLRLLEAASAPRVYTGTDIRVQPLDPAASSSPVVLTFAQVDTPGTASLTSSTGGLPLPTGFQLGEPPVYHEISTTAGFSGTVEVCISHGGQTLSGTPRLLHHENGAWTDVTTSVDREGKVVCGRVTSLSPFVVAGESFSFDGFKPPVDNDVVNRTRSGSAVPVKFSLGGYRGTDIFAAGYPRSTLSGACAGSASDQIEDVAARSATALTYDPISDRYTYVWKTDKAWSGCRSLVMRFRDDGPGRSALFEFRR